MATITPIFIVLALSVVSIQSIHNEGISGYCEKSRLSPFWYVPTPVECCDHRGKCDDVIEPMQTKYGLTNPDSEWPRRHCNCDRKLYNCVTKDLSAESLIWARIWGFAAETCFEESFTESNGSRQSTGMVFRRLLDAFPSAEQSPPRFNPGEAGKIYWRKSPPRIPRY